MQRFFDLDMEREIFLKIFPNWRNLYIIDFFFKSDQSTVSRFSDHKFPLKTLRSTLVLMP